MWAVLVALLAVIFLAFVWGLAALLVVERWDEVARCRVCGCTDHRACPDGCAWVPDLVGWGHLCSNCDGPGL